MILNHVALTVSDPERSAAFYAEHFGLEREHHDDDRPLSLSAPNGSLLALFPGPVRDVGRNHFGFELASKDEVRAARERFRAKGVTETEWQDDAIVTRVQVSDPDGYGVEIYCG